MSEMNETGNGMRRESKNEKLNHLSYWTPHTLERYAKHMKKGEITHGRFNWSKGGYPRHEYLESSMRHLIALWGNFERLGASIDIDREDHAAALIFNMQALMNEEYLSATIPRADPIESDARKSRT
jgi:hypothetical protein